MDSFICFIWFDFSILFFLLDLLDKLKFFLCFFFFVIFFFFFKERVVKWCVELFIIEFSIGWVFLLLEMLLLFNKEFVFWILLYRGKVVDIEFGLDNSILVLVRVFIGCCIIFFVKFYKYKNVFCFIDLNRYVVIYDFEFCREVWERLVGGFWWLDWLLLVIVVCIFCILVSLRNLLLLLLKIEVYGLKVIILIYDLCFWFLYIIFFLLKE